MDTQSLESVKEALNVLKTVKNVQKLSPLRVKSGIIDPHNQVEKKLRREITRVKDESVQAEAV